MSFVGLLAAQEMDEFVLEPQLVARFAQEAYIEADAVIVVRARTRWRSARTLAELDLQRLAVGERAVRIDGDGPRRGLVDSVSADELHLGSEARLRSWLPRTTRSWQAPAWSWLGVDQVFCASCKSPRACSRSQIDETVMPSGIGSRLRDACCEPWAGRWSCWAKHGWSLASPSQSSWRLRHEGCAGVAVSAPAAAL